MLQGKMNKPWPPGLKSLRVWIVMLLVGLLVAGGCGLDLSYLLPLAAGEINVLLRSVPLRQAIQSAGLAEEQVAKLELILDTREYARDVMGLTLGSDYEKFYDSGGDAVMFNVSACRRDAFEPRQWTFPIVGTVPYLGFFSRSAADAKVLELEEAGYDVFMYEVDAYSGAGYFPSVVLSPMLDRSDISLADTVFHELLHGNIWRPNDVSFNESLATFFGRTGAVKYFADRFPDQPELIQDAIETFEDRDRFSDFMLTLFNELDSYYASDFTSEEKIVGREAVYQAGRDRFAAEIQPLMHRPERYDWVASLPTDNAYMMGVRRYNLDLDVFENVFTATGEDWAASVAIFRAAAAHSDPYAYLQELLASSQDVLPSSNSAHSASGGVADTLRNGEAKSRFTACAVDAVESRSLPRGQCPEHLATTMVCPR